MQNNSTGMLATRIPVAVVPSPPRCPSWKIHTIAPKAALSESMLSTNAFSGIITLPVSRNSTANMITAMSPSTTGNRDVMASTLSRLTCAVPANSTSAPAGALDCVQAVELGLGGFGEQRRGAAHRQVRAAAGNLDRRHPGHVGHAGQIRCVPVDLGFGQTTGVGHHDGHGGRGVVGELGAHLVTDLVGRRGRPAAPDRRGTPTSPRGTGHRAAGAARRPPTRRGGRAA